MSRAQLNLCFGVLERTGWITRILAMSSHLIQPIVLICIACHLGFLSVLIVIFSRFIFGGVLLSTETAEDFQWAFQNFIDIMDGAAPITILTGEISSL